MAVDLNADVGEECGQDAALMRCISSANVACGLHAGNRAVMRETVLLAQKFGVAVGAHPGSMIAITSDVAICTSPRSKLPPSSCSRIEVLAKLPSIMVSACSTSNRTARYTTSPFGTGPSQKQSHSPPHRWTAH
jgi:hypothetical protein